MAYPPAYVRAYSFTDFETLNPGVPKPGDKIDIEYDAISNALTATQTNLALIQRADGALANGSVGVDQLQTGLFDGIADGITDEAQAAADAAAASAALAQAAAAAAVDSDNSAGIAAEAAGGSAAQAGVSQGIAQSAANDAALSASDAAVFALNSEQASNDTAGSVAACEAHVERAFEWAELLTGPVLPAPPGWPEAVDDGMFSSKWWAIRARDYNATEVIDLGTAGTDVGNAFDIWDAIPGNDLGVGQTYATWGTPTHTYVLIDRSNPSDPASWQDITGGPGPPGPPNTLTVGTVNTGAPGSAALVSITGVSPNQVLNMQIPAGDTGATGPIGPVGPPNALAIGTVTTVPDGTPSAATITGTAPTQTLNLTLTAGPQGIQGIQGIQGPAGPAVNLANPTGVVGLVAVNGVAATAPRSDSSPALSQAIVPTWTGAHKFTNVVKLVEVADPGLAAADEYWLTAQDDSGITRMWSHNSRAAWVINQDNYVIGRNVSGAAIAKMRCVRAVGGSANRPSIQLADIATGQAGGITAASAANNAFVEVMTLGVLTQVDTSAWAAGTKLYLGSAGVLTSVPPAYPGVLQLMAVVLDQHAVNGSIYVSRTSDVRAGLTAGDAFANPTGTVGLVAVNGSALTMPRSDSAPALSQAIVPTWTGKHTFTADYTGPGAAAIELASGVPILVFNETDAAVNTRRWMKSVNTGQFNCYVASDNDATLSRWLQVVRSVAAVASMSFGNATDNPTYNFLGTGVVTSGGVHRGPDGSAAAPTYSFAASTNSGMSRTGENVVVLSNNGIETARLLTGGGFQITGNGGGGYAGGPGLELIANPGVFYMTAFDRNVGFVIPLKVSCKTLDLYGYFNNVNITMTDFTAISSLSGDGYLRLNNDLHFPNGVYSPGRIMATNFTVSSSRALKRVTGTPRRAADLLARLRPLLYRLLDGDDHEQLGLIAEEVNEVCPQLSDGKSVAYDRLAILLLAAWQDEHAEAA